MRADGSEFPVELTVTRTGPPGAPAFTGYVRDITDRQRTARELMVSRARLVTAFDAARQRVTRDLHDGAQQRFVSAIISLQLARQKWASEPRRGQGTARPGPRRRPARARRATRDRHGDASGHLDPARPDRCSGRPHRQAPRPGPARPARAQASGADRGERLLLLRRGAHQRGQARPRQLRLGARSGRRRAVHGRGARRRDRRRPARSGTQRPDRTARPHRSAQRGHGHRQPGRRRHRAARGDPAAACRRRAASLVP